MLRRRTVKPKAILILLVVMVLLSLGFIERSLRRTIETIAAAQAAWTASNAINTAILEKVAANVAYSDLIQPERDSSNQIVFMQINTILLNKIKSEAELAIQGSLQSLEQERIKIPFGQIFGIKLLSNLGPSIRLILVPIGAVHIDVEDKFEAAGINQTRHRIYLTVAGEVKVVFPLIDATMPVATRIPIADAIIVGPVPQVYLGDALIKQGVTH